MLGKHTLFWIVLLLSVSFASAATIHGAIYDANFNTIDDIVLFINTTPKQNHISKNGAYFFNVPIGTFSISLEKFYQKELVYTFERIVHIEKDGEFQIDIVLDAVPGIDFPVDVKPRPSLLNLMRIHFNKIVTIGIIAAVVFIGIAILAFIRYKKKSGFTIAVPHIGEHKDDVSTTVSLGSTEHSYDLDGILSIIEEEGGRCTQKDIRRKIPLSEAKISLMITELVEQGKIKKIKRGRGNIIALRNASKEN